MAEIHGQDADIHFGEIDRPLSDWRADGDLSSQPDPDDELLAVTPPDVVAVLGFDPLEWERDNKHQKWSPGQPRDDHGRFATGSGTHMAPDTGGGTGGGGTNHSGDRAPEPRMRSVEEAIDRMSKFADVAD